MRRIILIIFCFFVYFEIHAQQRTSINRASHQCVIDDFIGTWELTKYADRNLNYIKRKVQPETLIFTKDSFFVVLQTKKYAGTWKFEKCEAIITLKETRQFNYHWTSRGVDDVFFTTKGLGYYKYFQRIKKSNNSQ